MTKTQITPTLDRWFNVNGPVCVHDNGLWCSYSRNVDGRITNVLTTAQRLREWHTFSSVQEPIGTEVVIEGMHQGMPIKHWDERQGQYVPYPVRQVERTVFKEVWTETTPPFKRFGRALTVGDPVTDGTFTYIIDNMSDCLVLKEQRTQGAELHYDTLHVIPWDKIPRLEGV